MFRERSGCPFCDERSPRLIGRVAYHDTVEADRRLPNVRGALFACAACGVAYPSHVYSVEYFARLYGESIEKLDGFHRSPLQRVRQNLLCAMLRDRSRPTSLSSLLDLASLRAFLVPPLSRRPRGLRVLDVGCGYGDFAAAFRRLGADVACTEIVPSLVERARALGFPCQLEEVERADFGERRFDVVFMRGVFYRTREPRATIAAVARLLAADGEWTLTDPCFGAEDARSFFEMQFPQGQFYILDRDRYGAMLSNRFGLRVTAARQIYGRPDPRRRSAGVGDFLAEFGEILLGNLLRRRPYVLAYSMRLQADRAEIAA